MNRKMTPRLNALAALAIASGNLVDLCAAASTPSRHATNGTDDDSTAHLQNIGHSFADHAGGAECLAALTPEQSNTDIAGASSGMKGNGLGKKSCAFAYIDGLGSAGAPTAVKMANDKVGNAGVVHNVADGEDDKAPIDAIMASAAMKKTSGAARRRA